MAVATSALKKRSLATSHLEKLLLPTERLPSSNEPTNRNLEIFVFISKGFSSFFFLLLILDGNILLGGLTDSTEARFGGTDFHVL